MSVHKVANFYLKPASSDIVQKLCKFIQVTDKTSTSLLSSHTHKKKEKKILILISNFYGQKKVRKIHLGIIQNN